VAQAELWPQGERTIPASFRANGPVNGPFQRVSSLFLLASKSPEIEFNMGATSTSRVAFSTSATSPALRNARKTLTRPSNPTWLQSDMVVTSLATESALCRCRFGMLEVLGPTDPDLRGRMAAAVLTIPRFGTCSIPP